MKAFKENRQGIYDTFKTNVYAKPALVPTMNWLDASPPPPPTELQVKEGKLTWNVANEDIRSWTFYKQEGSTWTLRQILPGSTTVATVDPGTYALCAVDRIGNESGGVAISV